MIATIRGKVTEIIDGRVVIEISGIGYEVNIGTPDLQALTAGQDSKLYIYEHLRESQHELFGFRALKDKALFEQLLSVNGVGPRMALAIMSQVADVSEAIASGSAASLQAVSGVGKRIAERIVVDLRNKLGSLGSGLPDFDSKDEAQQALVQLGYSPKQAQQALAKVPAKYKKEEERIRQALQLLGK